MVKISDAELEVMKVIWQKKETTSLEIIKEVKEFNWTDNTVRTLINRLINKKAVGISKTDGKTYTYIALIKENEYKTKRMRDFIKQFYDGSISNLIFNLYEYGEINISDLKHIKKVVESQKRKKGTL